MPEGLPNYLIGIGVCGLKLFLLPRVRVPGFALYLCASLGTSLVFLLGAHGAEPMASALVSGMSLVAALECNRLMLGLVGDGERDAVRLWCACVGVLLGIVAWLAEPEPYPGYSSLAYLVRVYYGVFSIGWLVALLGYCFVIGGGIRAGVIHASILLVRVLGLTAILFVHSREAWYIADGIGGVLNIATLTAWLWLNPLRAYGWRASRSLRSRQGNPASHA